MSLLPNISIAPNILEQLGSKYNLARFSINQLAVIFMRFYLVQQRCKCLTLMPDYITRYNLEKIVPVNQFSDILGPNVDLKAAQLFWPSALY